MTEKRATLNPSKCRSCGADVLWSTSKDGKSLILDAKPEKRVAIHPRTGRSHMIDVYMPHWATCPDSKSWKGKGKK